MFKRSNKKIGWKRPAIRAPRFISKTVLFFYFFSHVQKFLLQLGRIKHKADEAKCFGPMRKKGHTKVKNDKKVRRMLQKKKK